MSGKGTNRPLAVGIPSRTTAWGRATPTLDQPDIATDLLRRNIRIKSGTEKPANGFTAVKYRNHWFWIDDGDYRSKLTFAYLMILFSLTETGGKEGLPLVTIPSG